MESGRLTESIVKPKLFEPDRKGELFVYRVDELDCAGIRRIGDGLVAQVVGKSRLYGWGEIDRTVVTGFGLRIDHDDTPPRRANIVDWPKDAPERKLRQQQQANCAQAFKLV